jgi:hypothetical protein
VIGAQSVVADFDTSGEDCCGEADEDEKDAFEGDDDDAECPNVNSGIEAGDFEDTICASREFDEVDETPSKEFFLEGEESLGAGILSQDLEEGEVFVVFVNTEDDEDEQEVLTEAEALLRDEEILLCRLLVVSPKALLLLLVSSLFNRSPAVPFHSSTFSLGSS